MSRSKIIKESIAEFTGEWKTKCSPDGGGFMTVARESGLGLQRFGSACGDR